jgi:pimeloyl-ACP methyl ester carboxylesterase
MYRLLLALALFAAAPGASPLYDFDQSVYAQPQRLVDVGGGRRMNILCRGSGSPTVILDAGWGSSNFDWGFVLPAVAAFTRVCSFDRPGYGFSDPGALPRTTKANVDDLATLLRNARVAPPYIIVGHSLMGLDARLFASRYAAQVEGMLLVDPYVEGYYPMRRATLPQKIRAAALRDYADEMKYMQACEASRLCTPPPDPHVDPQVIAAHRATMEEPGHWTDMASEWAEKDSADKIELQKARHFGSLPIIVLTADTMYGEDKDLGATNAQATADQQLWNAMHDEIAAQSSRGVNCFVTHSGHYIQLDRPAVVTAAIRELTTLARTGANGTPACQPVL